MPSLLRAVTNYIKPRKPRYRRGRYFLGVDAGGTKTLAIVADETGRVLGVGLSGSGNFQGLGLQRARAAVRGSVREALRDAGLRSKQITASFFGMAGADRPRDFAIVRELLRPIVPNQMWGFDNDAVIGLFGGTGDGIGVGVVCGTGTNVIGVGPRHERVQVGGMGSLFGDAAGGAHIGRSAIAAAMRGREGRGPATSLYTVLCELYDVDDLLELVDLIYQKRPLHPEKIAPYVFKEAMNGDLVASQILVAAGQDMAVSAAAALNRIFTNTDRPQVVAMGSLFQKANPSVLLDAFRAELAALWPQADTRVLDCDPVLGAVFAAVSLLGEPPPPSFREILESSSEDQRKLPR